MSKYRTNDYRSPSDRARQAEARNAWLRAHPEQRRYGQYKAYAHSFLRIADAKDLNKIKSWLSQRS